MIFNPTLMFERGWEQYVGTGIYFWAVVTLCRELSALWRNEQAFEELADLLKRVNAAMSRSELRRRISRRPVAISDDERRILPRRIRQLMSISRRAAARR